MYMYRWWICDVTAHACASVNILPSASSLLSVISAISAPPAPPIPLYQPRPPAPLHQIEFAGQRQFLKAVFCFVGSFQIVTYVFDCSAEKFTIKTRWMNAKPCSLLRVKITTGFDLINRRCVNHYKSYMYMESCVYYPTVTCIIFIIINVRWESYNLTKSGGGVGSDDGPDVKFLIVMFTICFMTSA